jgi:hypothetical protein
VRDRRSLGGTSGGSGTSSRAGLAVVKRDPRLRQDNYPCGTGRWGVEVMLTGFGKHVIMIT